MRLPPSDRDRDAARWIVGSLLLGGADTVGYCLLHQNLAHNSTQTPSSIETFVLAMLKQPEAQRKAQIEIDTVVGSSRLPDFDDQEQLPYVSALVKEVLRWHPVIPLSECHLASLRT